MTHQGRPERAADLRDAVTFLLPSDQAGPAGEVYLLWQRAVERPLSLNALQRVLPEVEADQIAAWLDAGQGPPVSRAAAVLQAVVEDRPRDLATALLLADAALAQALGYTHMLPLLALGLKRVDLRKSGEELRLACHRAISVAAAEATREPIDLSRRAAWLRAIAPKLRAKGAEEAVALFLSEDAVAPALWHGSSANRSGPFPRRISGGAFKTRAAKTSHPVENPDANLGFCSLIFEAACL